MSDNTITRSRTKDGKLVVRRNTTVKQDLRDIARMLTGGRGGRQRREAIDRRVDEAVTGRKR